MQKGKSGRICKRATFYGKRNRGIGFLRSNLGAKCESPGEKKCWSQRMHCPFHAARRRKNRRGINVQEERWSCILCQVVTVEGQEESHHALKSNTKTKSRPLAAGGRQQTPSKREGCWRHVGVAVWGILNEGHVALPVECLQGNWGGLSRTRQLTAG